MNTVVKRLITASIAAPGVLALLFFAKRNNFRWAVALFIALAAGIAMVEFLNLTNKIGAQIRIVPTAILTGGGLFAFLFFPPPYQGWIIGGTVLAVVLINLEKSKFSQNVRNILFGLLGLIYIPWLLHYFFLIYSAETGVIHAINVLLIVWGYDSGAYFTGKLFGRYKITPNISPNKTLEGVLGGLLLAYGGASLSPIWYPYTYWIPHIVLVALLVGFAAQAGDLFESILKRKAKVDDSGTLLPGHGGVLDRIDSLLFALPVFYFYYHFILRFV